MGFLQLYVLECKYTNLSEINVLLLLSKKQWNIFAVSVGGVLFFFSLSSYHFVNLLFGPGCILSLLQIAILKKINCFAMMHFRM